jgi:hypothetical protein
MEKMTVQILQIKNMIIGEEFHEQNAEYHKEQTIMEVKEGNHQNKVKVG